MVRRYLENLLKKVKLPESTFSSHWFTCSHDNAQTRSEHKCHIDNHFVKLFFPGGSLGFLNSMTYEVNAEDVNVTFADVKGVRTSSLT